MCSSDLLETGAELKEKEKATSILRLIERVSKITTVLAVGDSIQAAIGKHGGSSEESQDQDDCSYFARQHGLPVPRELPGTKPSKDHYAQMLFLLRNADPGWKASSLSPTGSDDKHKDAWEAMRRIFKDVGNLSHAADSKQRMSTLLRLGLTGALRPLPQASALGVGVRVFRSVLPTILKNTLWKLASPAANVLDVIGLGEPAVDSARCLDALHVLDIAQSDDSGDMVSIVELALLVRWARSLLPSHPQPLPEDMVSHAVDVVISSLEDARTLPPEMLSIRRCAANCMGSVRILKGYTRWQKGAKTASTFRAMDVLDAIQHLRLPREPEETFLRERACFVQMPSPGYPGYPALHECCGHTENISAVSNLKTAIQTCAEATMQLQRAYDDVRVYGQQRGGGNEIENIIEKQATEGRYLLVFGIGRVRDVLLRSLV